MKSTLIAFCLTLIIVVIAGCGHSDKPTFEAPLLDNLGSYHIPITTDNEYAAQFFNQGIIMANAFNHLEAARSFRECIRLDSTCAMAYWGLAYVLGPNYNTGSNLGELNEIREAVRRANEYKATASEWEQALIESSIIKFPPLADTVNATSYKEALYEVYKKFPDNDFVATLYAESIMNLHAWDLYSRKGGEPRPWTPEVVNVLEHAMAINPDNPLANHLYIHATEAAPDVEKALESAARLKTLVPGAGHLVHMPSHIYINTGDYHEGSLANEQAVIVDSIYIAECNVQGVYPQLYYPHNYHFLAATAALEGRGARAIEASFKTAQVIEKTYLQQEGYATTQHYITIPYNVLVKFSQWEKILALPAPENEQLKYPLAIWHYARGMALANTGKLEEAKKELTIIQELAQTDEVKKIVIWEINKATDITDISSLVLSGEIARIEGNYTDAASFFKQAIVIEDQLNYNEPPDWFFSVRHFLGDLYLEMGEHQKAEAVFREDLTYWVKNGYALNGLYHSLLFQNRPEEAEEIRRQFEESWKYADSTLKYSRIDERERKNLALRISNDTPADLIYIAESFCISKK